jgi:hypothetical protein
VDGVRATSQHTLNAGPIATAPGKIAFARMLYSPVRWGSVFGKADQTPLAGRVWAAIAVAVAAPSEDMMMIEPAAIS